MTDEQLAIKWYEENKHLFTTDNIRTFIILAYMSGIIDGWKQAKDELPEFEDLSGAV